MKKRRFSMMIMLLTTMCFVSSALLGCKTTEEKAVQDVEATPPKVTIEPVGVVKEAEEAIKAAEAQKAAEAKMVGEERKAAEEAKKIIIARVNGVDINMYMLVRAMNRVSAKYVKKDESVTPEMTKKIQQEALDRLIFEELAVQEAIKQGINPAPDAIEKVVAQVRENAGSEQAYKEYLDKAFLTEDALKKLIERSQRYELISARELYGKVKVDEKLVKDEYEKEKGKFILPDNFVVEDVLFLQGKDEEATRKKAGEVLETIKNNNNDIWKLVQDGTFIIRKIKITKEKYPEIYKTMTDLKAGELSGVIKDKDSYHIIKVVKKEPSRQSTFEEARPVIEPRFLVPAQDQRKEEWRRELRKDAKIEIMTEEIEKNLKEAAGKQAKEKKCYCTHECYFMTNILFNSRLYPALAREYIQL